MGPSLSVAGLFICRIICPDHVRLILIYNLPTAVADTRRPPVKPRLASCWQSARSAPSSPFHFLWLAPSRPLPSLLRGESKLKENITGITSSAAETRRKLSRNLFFRCRFTGTALPRRVESGISKTSASLGSLG